MQQNQAKLYVEREFTVAQADQRLFSSFLEHLGRAIYEGIYEPGHPLADEDGFRTDVLKLVRELGVSHVRYPGGNFLSGYNWRDGIGPKEKRPTRLDLAWHTIESNQFGIDAFFPILRFPQTLEQAMQPREARENLIETVEQVFRLIRTARGLSGC